MINFVSSFESVKREAAQGAEIVNKSEGGHEIQHFNKGQRVHYTNNCPVRFYDGVITEVYTENGYYYYVVSFDGRTRTFRQSDIELNDAQENLSTSRVKAVPRGKVYFYSTNEKNDVITINGVSYRVGDVYGYAIQIKKTKINASGGAFGLLRFLSSQTFDIWENKILNNCKPIK